MSSPVMSMSGIVVLCYYPSNSVICSGCRFLVLLLEILCLLRMTLNCLSILTWICMLVKSEIRYFIIVSL